MTERNREAEWFGDRHVDPTEKPGLVRDVFDRVAARYDLMNDVMSGGIHRLWKDHFVASMRPRPGQLLLDVAGGTGDIARRFLKRAGTDAEGRGARAILCDLTPAMVRVGRDRSIDASMVGGLSYAVGDAEKLPIADRSVDRVTIAFGLRNVARIDDALAEAHRVLKPGGLFYCLEFSRVRSAALRRLYDLYSFRVIPEIGRAVAQDRDAYAYLVESIRKFPAQEELASRMEAAGLKRVRWENLSAGIAAIHWGWRI
ncbi:MAG: class I SAM-dependent methyltransferase [Rhodospirillaceae bacterium]|nr:class I SAM-dependent methyltransferase [Rhodospirillaceae bacterium]